MTETEWELQQDDVDGAGAPAEDPQEHVGESGSADIAPAPSAPPQFNYNERLYAFGYTSSGKSEILNLLFSGCRCQKILIDNKPEFAIDGVEPVSDPDALDWREPVMHYQPAPGSDISQYEPIFAQAFTRRGLLICVHEWGALVDYNANKAGRYLVSYVAQGQRLGLGLLAGSTRPKAIPTAGITEASHFLVFGESFAKRDDMDAAAEAISPVNGRPIGANELMRELGALHQEHGPYAFLWKARRNGQLLAMPGLPEEMRRLSIVRRIEDA